MTAQVVRVTAKGQLTVPVSIRRSLGIREGDYLAVYLDGDGIRLKKVEPVRPLDEDDPFWRLVGSGASGLGDVAENHDRYLAEGERERWKG
jgi:transcriptional pleiotropic regulator of transition state genes